MDCKFDDRSRATENDWFGMRMTAAAYSLDISIAVMRAGVFDARDSLH